MGDKSKIHANTKIVPAGHKWCSGCKADHPASEFGKDSSRWDGLMPSCREYKNLFAREGYVWKIRTKPPGPAPLPARNGDKKQARKRVNLHVREGRWPHPNAVDCNDCGHVWSLGERRHEYDHYLGYAPQHHESVQVVCTKCHANREMSRGVRRSKGTVNAR